METSNLLGIRLRELFLPEVFRGSMMLHDFFLLARIVQFDQVRALAHPIEEELRGSFADPPGKNGGQGGMALR
jgi:hypothetical protein